MFQVLKVVLAVLANSAVPDALAGTSAPGVLSHVFDTVPIYVALTSSVLLEIEWVMSTPLTWLMLKIFKSRLKRLTVRSPIIHQRVTTMFVFAGNF